MHSVVLPVSHMRPVQVFDFWPQSLANFARKQRAGLGLLVGRWGTPVPRKVSSQDSLQLKRIVGPQHVQRQGQAPASLDAVCSSRGSFTWSS